MSKLSQFVAPFLAQTDLTALYTVTAADHGSYLRTTSGSGDLTLPSCAAVGFGFWFYYTNNSTAFLNLTRVGTDTFQSGGNSYQASRGQTVKVVCEDASATGKWKIFSTGATGSGTDSVAVGGAAQASATNAVAVGTSAVASGASGVAVGPSAQAAATAVAMGSNAQSVAGANGIAIGASAVNNATTSGICLGASSVVNGPHGTAVGNSAVSNGAGKYVYSGGNASDTQFGLQLLRALTTGTVVVMSANNNAADATNQLLIGTNQVLAFTGTLIGKQTGSANIAAYTITGTLVNNGGTVTMPTGTLTLIGADSIGLTTAPVLAADNTNKCLAVTSGAKTATSIRWAASIRQTELTYA